MNLKTSLAGFICAVALLAANKIYGQVGINTTTPDANSALDIVDTQKGVLIPRMNQTQANSLAALIPADGMLIYNSTAQCVQIYKRTSPTAGAFDCLVVTSGSDATNDAWINDNPNTQVKLGTLSNGTSTRPAGTEFVAKDDGKIGIGISNPLWSLDILGPLAIGQLKRVTSTTAALNNAPGFLFTRARGTLAAQTDITPGDFLGKVQFRGHIGGADTDYSTFAYIAKSTTPESGRFGFFNGSGESGKTEIMSILTDDMRVGVGTITPQKSLHVNGSLQVTNELNVGGNATTAGSAGVAGQFLTSNGPGTAPTWQSPAGIVPTSNGTVIAVNGNLLVAQEIIAQLSADFSTTSAAGVAIGNLNTEIIDNENTYTGNATTNSFTVSTSGVYQVFMNMQLSSTVAGNPVIGIWDNTAAGWVARVNDAIGTGLQTFTLITSITMDATHTYSFRIATSSGTVTVRAISSGTSGSGPVSQASVKRLR